MAPEPKRPDIERITNRYLDAWERFGEDRFTVEELENELLRARDPEDVPSDKQINNDLYRVAVLGLVDWFGEGEYRAAVSPETKESEWADLIEDQLDWIRSEIKDRIEERSEEPEADGEELLDSPEIIEHKDNEYMSAFVGRKSEVDGQARYYQAALSPGTHDGVVLRAYQDVADSAEKLGKKISNDDIMSDTVCVYRFDIADMEMKDIGDHLEYRVYLNENKLL